MAVPAMYGYAAVIFRDPLYAASMPTLSKLVCWSSAVHQV
jgi:SulP family sulfate permease